MFRYPIVVVEWLDAHARPQTVEYLESEIDQQHKAEPVRTLGLLAKSDATGVSLYNEETGPDGIRGLSFIPRQMIVSETLYRLVKPRQPKTTAPPSAAT